MGESIPAEASTANPTLECDVVMAGGVTSGIIYPGALAVIARRYTFRSIGGTSVGAIAAAVTAAAEYGRVTKSNPKAFDGLADMPHSLGDVAPDGHSRLFHLFTPEPATKPLMDVVAPLFAGGGKTKKVLGVARATLKAKRIGVPVGVLALASLVPFVFLWLDGHLFAALIALLAAFALCIAAWLGATALTLWLVWLPAWRHNGYGLCTGNKNPTQSAEGSALLGLTPWMHEQVQKAAGRPSNRPMTFGDLWGAGGKVGEEPSPSMPRKIDLAMIVSDISRNRSAQLPFLEAASPLYIETAVLKRYFPSEIANWMCQKAGDFDPKVRQPGCVIRLPHPQNLPIVFGARLSLSFPVLLSAVPLMTPDFAKTTPDGWTPLRRIWFSDGGLTSNFPIHFFDSPIPTRPTFCLNLVGFDEVAPGIGAGAGDADKPIARASDSERLASHRPKNAKDVSRADRAKDVWRFISMSQGHHYLPSPFTTFDSGSGTGALSFANAVVGTARSWSDNQMLVAPGVRDRVVNIGLKSDEGGLNLDMKANVIADLDQRGRAAGLLISARFDPDRQNDPETSEPNVQCFASHRWVRYRNFMAGFEDLSRRFATSRRASDAAALARKEPVLHAMIDGLQKEKLGYPIRDAARQFYHGGTDDLETLAIKLALATRVNPDATFDRPRASLPQTDAVGTAPRPRMRLRLRPLDDNDPRAEAADLL